MSLVIFVEELSMKATLENLIEKLNLNTKDILILEHQGKSDLESSWRKKLPAWNVPNTKFIILRDGDGKDCIALKKDLNDVAEASGKRDFAAVRIVCQELEAWFLGDVDALRELGYIQENSNPRELRDPDSHLKPSEILSRWKPSHQKTAGAREISKCMSFDLPRDFSSTWN